MKRKTILSASFAVLLLVLLVSCSFVQPRRTIRILIPQHPWEKVSGRKLWYTLRWTDSDGLKTLHVTQDMRAVDIEVDPGRTTVVAAYPLGELSPFGTAVTPADNRKEVLLSQDEGFLTSLLSDIDTEMTGTLNYGLILEEAQRKTDDIRKIDDVSLLRDIQNGELSKDTIRVSDGYCVGPFALANGIWESEFLRDPCLVSIDGLSGTTVLPAGVFRFLNAQSNMVLVLIVDRDGNSYSYIKESLI